MTNYKGDYEAEFEDFDIELNGDLEYVNNYHGSDDLIMLVSIFQAENRARLEEITSLLRNINNNLIRMYREMEV